MKLSRYVIKKNRQGIVHTVVVYYIEVLSLKRSSLVTRVRRVVLT